MNLKEKLERISNPKSVEDYGLSICLSELMTFEEGRCFVDDFFTKYVPLDKWPESLKKGA